LGRYDAAIKAWRDELKRRDFIFLAAGMVPTLRVKMTLAQQAVPLIHGGRIDVETEPGAFTEFTITLARGNGAAVGPR
jgi:hypothetical protein